MADSTRASAEASPAGPGGGYGEGLAPGARSPAPYAASSMPGRGRRHGEPECPTRSPFQRDRDRVLHASAFRRLIHKTQVFIYHEGDHYRTRLTHSLEVAQIARTIARQLRLDEDLAEALALAHDLGHPPFGHAGERALDRAMAGHGGFDHNAQSLRVVAALEHKYAAFDGLNLTWETLEGLAKHNGPVDAVAEGGDGAAAPGRLGEHGGALAVAKVARGIEDGWRPLDLDRWPSAEAQVAAIADDIAYSCHDVDDGLRAGLVTMADIREAPLARDLAARLPAACGEAAAGREIYELTRAMITTLITDVVAQSRARLAALAPATADGIRAAGAAVVAFSPERQSELALFKQFLFARVYRHPRITRIMADAERIVADLFARYLADGAALPPAWQRTSAGLDAPRRARLVADFIAGMTDRYAIGEHRRLFAETPDLR